jgi:hypothetical protein
VAILNPEHLLDQAERLIARARGAPRQVDLRRAVSNTYYGLFHAVSIAAADHFIGKGRQSAPIYALVYRSIDHRALRQLCEDIVKPTVPAKYQPYLAGHRIGAGIEDFALALVDLQVRRQAADYDPLTRLSIRDARIAIRLARRALMLFGTARGARRMFLLLLLFSPR